MEHFEIVKIEERDTESSEQNYVETETFGNGNFEIASSTTGNCEIENFLIDSFDVENTATLKLGLPSGKSLNSEL